MGYLNKIIKYSLFLYLLFFLKSLAFSSESIKFIESTGRAYIKNDENISIARRMALDDAIYVAAMSGGARISGFSSVNEQTIISDYFTVEAESTLLDFDIIKEEVVDSHYVIKIKAALGKLDSLSCTKRKKISVTFFKPDIIISSNSPAWIVGVAENMALDAINFFENSPQINSEKVLNVSFKKGNLSNEDDEYDYKALTSGKVKVYNGDLAYVPNIMIDFSSLRKGYEKNSYLNFKLVSEIYNGDTYDLGEKSIYEGVIKLDTQTPWRTLDIIAKSSRKQIELIILSGIEEHISDLIEKIKCIPLNAKLKYENEKLFVDLGSSHGISKNNLGFTNSINTPYTIFNVVETTNKKAFLEPLNKTINVSTLIGKNIDFVGSKK